MNAKVDSSKSTAQPLLNQEEILKKAQQYATEHDLNFTGSLTPSEAWQLLQNHEVVLVDVRTNEERKFVGYIPESIHIAWATGTAFNRNPRFLKELENKVGKDKTILLLCRSGKRSAIAAEAAFNAGFENVYNILEGFEGDLDEQQQRGHLGGWKIHQLPWIQD
ncbi:rhodanese-like domain-containing protein [Acinetobacter stercoris]|uniref:Molybdopterin biosynthesis protein MoeB n=1 Tax=Acinetobacter stercoris TaxID=2126983 RepID=A0A2U3N1Z0_9GAMM|nr:rhodanese-like domain-containing protein [Acinetobacter stercoris]SPL71697.1 molybdopterin biosynthesis protein MoeB [Acinetobacter stercoris]